MGIPAQKGRYLLSLPLCSLQLGCCLLAFACTGELRSLHSIYQITYIPQHVLLAIPVSVRPVRLTQKITHHHQRLQPRELVFALHAALPSGAFSCGGSRSGHDKTELRVTFVTSASLCWSKES